MTLSIHIPVWMIWAAGIAALTVLLAFAIAGVVLLRVAGESTKCIGSMFGWCILLAILSSCAMAQDPPYQPPYWIGAGSSYNYYSTPAAQAGWVSFGARFADRTYSFSTMDLTRTQASIRTGVARIMAQQGPMSLLAMGDAGMSTVNGVALGSFSGGGILLYDLGALSKRLTHVYATAIMRVIGVSSATVQPVFEAGISFSLGR